MADESLGDLLRHAIAERVDAGLESSYRTLQEVVEAEETRRPRGLSLNRTTASQIVRGTYKGEPTPGTVRAIGWLAGVTDAEAFDAAGRPSPGVPFAEELPPGVDDLSPKERRAAIEILRALIAQRHEINRLTISDPASSPLAPQGNSDRPESQSDYDLAGGDRRTSTSEGVQRRRTQDRSAEPDAGRSD